VCVYLPDLLYLLQLITDYNRSYYIIGKNICIVLPEEKKAFEIKYSSRSSQEQSENLLDLPDDFQLFLVGEETYDTWELEGRQINVIPLWVLTLTT